MGQTGLITFSEYLFLLCILTRPRQGFDVAFKMFDEDGNKQIDYDEFKLLGQGCLQGSPDGDGRTGTEADQVRPTSSSCLKNGITSGLNKVDRK